MEFNQRADMTLVSTTITAELYVRPRRWPALAISLLLHGGLTLIVAAGAHVYYDTRPEASGRFRLKMMSVREPQRLFMARMAHPDGTHGDLPFPEDMAVGQVETAALEQTRLSARRSGEHQKLRLSKDAFQSVLVDTDQSSRVNRQDAPTRLVPAVIAELPPRSEETLVLPMRGSMKPLLSIPVQLSQRLSGPDVITALADATPGSTGSVAQAPAAATLGTAVPARSTPSIESGTTALRAGALRIDHPPNGRFDVVIMHTALSALLPHDVAAVMNNQPVYTVYLQVGDSREWTMYYWPKDASTTQNGSIVTLGDPRPITPPYPTITLLPAALPFSTSNFVYIHGLIDSDGLFQELRVVGEDARLPEAFLSVLGQWRFRPSHRGDDAANVEILLAIPVHRT